MSARDRILARVREALEGRARAEAPAPFGEWRPHGPADSPVDGFARLFEAAGGEVVRVADEDEGAAWLAAFAADFPSAAAGATVPARLQPAGELGPPESAPLGVSMARGAVAETGSLLMDARDGRRAQLLCPTHVVFVHAGRVHATLREALTDAGHDLPSAVGLHSGPSKSADIGQVLVKGVHGPGRLVAVVLG